MMFLHSALVAGLATIGQAILLPPSASSADADIANTLPFEAKSGAEGRTLDLECRHCPVPTKQQNELKWISDVESKLQLQFEIVESELDTLQLNGVQIYPPHDLPLEPIGAPQITQETLLNDYTVFLNLGYELDITPAMKSENDQLELILVRFQVVEIAGRFVDGLDSVLLKLLKTPNGKLMIGDLGTGPTINPGGKDCQTLICQMKKIVTGKLSHLKPKKGCGSKAAPVKGHPHGHGGHSSEHGSEHGTHRHHRHHGLSRFLHALKRAAFHVLIPVLIGIAAGFTASLLGMLVGQTAVFLWRTFYRRGRKGPYSRVERNEMETDEKDQKKSLLEHQDPPPVYEDVVEDVKLME
jgi:hypothetical protein